MGKVQLPREVLLREIECDKHNLQEAVNMMGDKFDKKLGKYCRLTVKYMHLTMRQNMIYGWTK